MGETQIQTMSQGQTDVIKWAGIISFIVILFGAIAIQAIQLKEQVTTVAEINAADLAHILQTEHDKVLDDQPIQLDESVISVLTSHNIVKTRYFSADGRIICSPDRKTISTIETGNTGLNTALSGAPSSEIVRNLSLSDLDNEERTNITAIKMYIPIIDVLGEVSGVFEFYQDVSLYHEAALHSLSTSLLLLGAVLAITYMLTYRIINSSLTKCQYLNQQSTTDPITGLVNSKEILNIGHKEFARYVRNADPEKRTPFGLVIADIDQYKDILTKYGSRTGDLVLQQVSIRLQETLRDYNTLGRIGGESFMILLPNTSPDQAKLVGERILSAINESYIVGEKMVEHHVTMSVGLSVSKNTDANFDELMRRADTALYLAKEGGANQSVIRT